MLSWGKTFRFSKYTLESAPTPSLLKQSFDFELKEYFRLCCLARSTSADQDLSASAENLLFQVRVALERSIDKSIGTAPCHYQEVMKSLFSASFFGCSKKQGTSLRMPLASCKPTSLCAGGCYAHDVLDASPFAMVRGVINGYIAKEFEEGGSKIRKEILRNLRPHTQKAVRHARKELKNLPRGFNRRPYIRFSHVGEVANYPNFANALAMQVRSLSRKGVDCVIYTRHPKANELNPELWIMNFTLDPSSLNRVKWIPKQARIVYSAFGGITSSLAEVNFLEHHRHQHLAQTEGDGKICPATKPETIERTCDACRCNTCFVKPNN